MRLRKAAVVGAVVAVAGGGATFAVGQNGGNGQGGTAAEPQTHASECAEVEKKAGAFGKCVSDRASSFGRQTAEEASEGKSGGNGNRGAEARGKDGNGNGGGATASTQANPTEGLTRPPEQHGRDFGHEVADNTRQNAGGNSEGRNPTEGVTPRPPEGVGADHRQESSEFGQQVADNARGDRGGPPANAPAGR